MDHVERVGGKLSRQPAEHRDEAALRRRDGRELVDERGERAAVADADGRVFSLLDGVLQEQRPGRGERAQGEGTLLQVGRDAAVGKAEALRQCLFEPHAIGDADVDMHAHEPVAIGAGHEPVRLGGRDVEPLGDLRLGEPAGEIEPGGAGSEARFVVDRACARAQRQKVGLPGGIFFACCNFFHMGEGASRPDSGAGIVGWAQGAGTAPLPTRNNDGGRRGHAASRLCPRYDSVAQLRMIPLLLRVTKRKPRGACELGKSHGQERANRPFPRRAAAFSPRRREEGAVALHLDDPQRQPSARERGRAEGRRASGLLRLARHDHDGALFRRSCGPRTASR